MKNFFKFLLVFVGVILVYVYNNPEVIDKYKIPADSAGNDSINKVEKTVTDTSSVEIPVVDSAKVDIIESSDSINVSDSTLIDTVVSSEPKKLGLDTVKPKVNVDTFIYSLKSA